MSPASTPRAATGVHAVAGALSPALRVVDLARRAPSIRNSQPWGWSVDGTTIHLYADWDRWRRRDDPAGRHLLISCGLALHHAEVAARGLGWEAVVSRFPHRDGARHDLVARLDLVPSFSSPDGAAELTALTQRRTDRRRFTSWPVPEELVQDLCASAGDRGGLAVSLPDVVDRFRVEHLVGLAQRLGGGAPVESAGGPRWLAGTGTSVEVHDGLVVLCSQADGPESWTTVGESLGALWLTAVRRGLAVVPLSQIIEIEDTRQSLRSSVLGGLVLPQLLVRVGWQPIGHTGLPRTSRRSLESATRPRPTTTGPDGARPGTGPGPSGP